MSPAEKKRYFGFDMAKNVSIELSGDEFFMMSISKIMVPLYSVVRNKRRPYIY